MTIIHLGTKTWPPSYGGVEKIVYDLAIGICTRRVIVLADCVANYNPPGNAGNVVVDRLAPGLIAARRQLLALGARRQDVVLHFHKETSIPLALLMKLSGARCLLTLHGFAWRISRWAWWQRLALWLLDLLAYAILDRIVFVGESDWRAVRRWLPLRKLRLIRNGVAIAQRSHTCARSQRWMFLGRLSPEKNINTMIEAAIAAGLGLDLYGSLDDRDAQFASRFRRLASRPGICWHGAVSFQDVPRTLMTHAVLVNVSHSEGLPVSVLEAAAFGLFLVLSDIPQHRLLRFPAACYVDPKQPDFRGLTTAHLDGTANTAHVAREFALESMLAAYASIVDEFAA